jgi:hypothetical protein
MAEDAGFELVGTIRPTYSDVSVSVTADVSVSVTAAGSVDRACDFKLERAAPTTDGCTARSADARDAFAELAGCSKVAFE